ncbi:sensor domain-containing protein [Thiobacillus sedimenti]|uniref:EAL domain-containing protein n=1 Tax=Thiobacillus sedimenti TaxID=3110231 RepID=A0ABZ1CJ01_9PROT|nr:EAL domain-containing protein [Thiobacillus sp. SCUT-2]WRS38935.1 EAL domain-containing protein [Thiobacillus sp. SCUT-2]
MQNRMTVGPVIRQPAGKGARRRMLRTFKNYYESLFHASPNAYILLTPDLILVDINAAHLRLTGFERQEVLGRHLFDVFPVPGEAQLQQLRASFARVVANEVEDTIHHLHYPIVHRTGTGEVWEDRYWTVVNTPLFDEDGEVSLILNYVTDISHFFQQDGAERNRFSNLQDIRRANLALELSAMDSERKRLRALMEQAPGFVAVGRGNRHTFELANKAYYQLVGHRELLGKPVREALPELEGQGFYELLDQVYQSGKPFIGRAMPILFQQEPGSPLVERYIDFVYQPIFEQDGTVSGIFVQGHDVTEAHELSQKLSHQAAHDSLTGLFNRREFGLQVERAIKNLSGKHDGHSLMYLDLDQFKLVNDTCGHRAGDEFLRLISMVLNSKIKSTDILARLGGDEFGLLLENCPIETACHIAEELRQAIKDVEFIWQNRVFGGSVSIGLLSFSDPATSPADALSAADSACFLAKEKGRNRVQVYRQEDNELVARWREMDWVGRLRTALKEERIELYAQRIEALSSDAEKVAHHEILIRLRDDEGEMVPPMAFIPAAERYGLMPSIDRYVIEKAFAYLADENKPGGRPLLLSINLSGNTLNDEHIASFISKTAQASGVNPAQICFEITETAAVANLTHTASLIGEIKQHGFRFALDDFGSGMSSFGYLKYLPVDFLKIDGVFIKHILEDKVDAAMVEAIARVASVMGIQTVAEYVENDTVRKLLEEIGVDYGQGYGIHEPEPIRSMSRR